MRNKKEHSNLRVLLKVVSAIAVAIATLLIIVYAIFKHYYNKMDTDWDTGYAYDTSEFDDESYGDEFLYTDLDENSDVLEQRTDLVIDNDDYSDNEEELTVDADSILTENLEKVQRTSDLYKTDTFNILVIGVDSRKNNFSGRSDSMILLSIDKRAKKIYMTSFLRDTYVSIPECWDDRLNAAYAYGGSKLLMDTIKANYGISVEKCVVVNFGIVTDFVDFFGGVDLELSDEEIGVMNKYYISNPVDKIEIKASKTTYHLNGAQALAYSRVRYVGTDFARTARQRKVMMLCFDKAKDMSVKQLDDAADIFLPRVKTNLTEGDCASLMLMAVGLSGYEIETMSIPMDGTWSSANIGGKSVLLVDFEANSKAWYEWITEEK